MSISGVSFSSSLMSYGERKLNRLPELKGSYFVGWDNKPRSRQSMGCSAWTSPCGSKRCLDRNRDGRGLLSTSIAEHRWGTPREGLPAFVGNAWWCCNVIIRSRLETFRVVSSSFALNGLHWEKGWVRFWVCFRVRAEGWRRGWGEGGRGWGGRRC